MSVSSSNGSSNTQRSGDSIRKGPPKVAVAIALLALILNIAMLAFWVQRTRAANALAAEITEIRENVAHTGQIGEQEIEKLRAQVDTAEQKLTSLQRGLSGTESPFDLWTEVFDIAEQSGLAILSVRKEGVTTQDTAAGSLTATKFSVEVQGTFTNFTKFVQNLEATAQKAVTVDNIVLTGEGTSGTLEVTVLSGVKAPGP